jgi:Large eukaryotic DNA virus major capsid protein/Major capsid protein N-terminus/2OG-Fe(II) oxygenase superfamily
MKQVHTDGIYIIENFLSKKVCNTFINQITKAEEETSRKFAEVCDFYNHKEINSDLSQFFWTQLKDIIPQKYVDAKGKTWNPSKPSEYIATAHYKEGEKFNIHTDTGIHDKDDESIKSKFTTLIYLNSNFRGGETVFFNEKFQETITIKPKTGTLLMFDIDLWHSAMPIRKGEKYWIGLELMYALQRKEEILPSVISLSPQFGNTYTPPLRNTPLKEKPFGIKTGPQDIYYTTSKDIDEKEFSNPVGDEYDKTFKRYPKSVTKPFIVDFNGVVDFKKKCATLIPNEADLIKDMFVNVTLPKLDEYHRWVPYVGEALIKLIELEIGGQRIDRHTSEFLHVYGKLFLTETDKKTYYKKIGHVPENYNKVADDEGNWDKSEEYTLSIPLRFSFNRFIQNSLPLAALYSHDVKVNIEFREIEQLVECKSNCHCKRRRGENANIKVILKNNGNVYDDSYYCEYVKNLHLDDAKIIVEGTHVDDEQYNKIITDNHEISMDQLQFTGDEFLKTTENKIRLNFNHPVKELIFFCLKYSNDDIKRLQSINRESDLKDATNILEMCNYIKEAQLQFNGRDHIPFMPEKYFTTDQQMLHHTNQDDNIYCYSFATNPEEYQPTQSMNFSQIDNGTLRLKLKEGVIQEEDTSHNKPFEEGNVPFQIFALNHGVFRVMCGMGGLAFSK